MLSNSISSTVIMRGTPGSLLTFLVWEDGAPGRVGLGQVAEISLAIDPGSVGFWITRALSFGIPIEGPSRDFGETVLRLRDPDGIAIKLVGADIEAKGRPADAKGITASEAIKRIRGATLFSNDAAQTVSFLESFFGYRRGSAIVPIQRMVSESGDVVDVRDAAGFWPGAPGTGVVDHIAFRAPDIATLRKVEHRLRALNSTTTNSHDRKYFVSLYVRETGGTLFELATDGPGMLVDEQLETLGTRLFVPPGDAARAEDLQVMLPQFAMPGEERIRYLELPFVHRFSVPDEADGTTLVLLHGSGGNETDLMPLASRIAPRAQRLGVRGRSTEEQTLRWFRRFSTTSFDQADIRSEAEAFAEFVREAVEGYALEPDKLIFLGYSNGANFIVAVTLLHPGLIKKAVLLRPTMVLQDPPNVTLFGTHVVLVPGETDFPLGHLETTETALRERNAYVDVVVVRAGHALDLADVDAGKQALSLLNTVSQPS